MSALIPILTASGPFAFTLAIARSLPRTARGVMTMVAGLTAIISRDDRPPLPLDSSAELPDLDAIRRILQRLSPGATV